MGMAILSRRAGGAFGALTAPAVRLSLKQPQDACDKYASGDGTNEKQARFRKTDEGQSDDYGGEKETRATRDGNPINANATM
jgi:hypothetical protein